MKIRGIEVNLSFVFSHLPEDNKKKKTSYKMRAHAADGQVTGGGGNKVQDCTGYGAKCATTQGCHRAEESWPNYLIERVFGAVDCSRSGARKHFLSESMYGRRPNPTANSNPNPNADPCPEPKQARNAAASLSNFCFNSYLRTAK